MGACKWCGGTGRCRVEEGSSLSYVCPDCDGQGYLPECDNCGAESTGEFEAFADSGLSHSAERKSKK